LQLPLALRAALEKNKNKLTKSWHGLGLTSTNCWVKRRVSQRNHRTAKEGGAIVLSVDRSHLTLHSVGTVQTFEIYDDVVEYPSPQGCGET